MTNQIRVCFNSYLFHKVQNHVHPNTSFHLFIHIHNSFLEYLTKLYSPQKFDFWNNHLASSLLYHIRWSNWFHFSHLLCGTFFLLKFLQCQKTCCWNFLLGMLLQSLFHPWKLFSFFLCFWELMNWSQDLFRNHSILKTDRINLAHKSRNMKWEGDVIFAHNKPLTHLSFKLGESLPGLDSTK